MPCSRHWLALCTSTNSYHSLMEHCQVSEQDMVLISGVGSVWPVMRAHALLNKLHAMMGDKPLILFYPGVYSGQTLTLFNRVPSNPYYRAFQLVP